MISINDTNATGRVYDSFSIQQGNKSTKNRDNKTGGLFSDEFSSITSNKLKYADPIAKRDRKERNISLKLRNNTIFVPYQQERNSFGEIINPSIDNTNLEELNL